VKSETRRFDVLKFIAFDYPQHGIPFEEIYAKLLNVPSHNPIVVSTKKNANERKREEGERDGILFTFIPYILFFFFFL